MVHADTTRLTLYGEYPTADEIGAVSDPSATVETSLAPPDTARPMRGDNQDGHQDGKPLVLGTAGRPDGIPVWGDGNDGNRNDTIWNRPAMTVLRDALTARPVILFVADSKRIADETGVQLCTEQVHVVSRMPNSFGLTAATKPKAAPQATWTLVGAVAQRTGAADYRLWETSGTIRDQVVRLVVGASSALVTKADARVARDREDAARRVDRSAKRLSRQRCDCEADARRALEIWQKETQALAWWHLKVTLEPTTRRRRRPEGGPLNTFFAPKSWHSPNFEEGGLRRDQPARAVR